MATQLQLRRGTTSQNSYFKGAMGEVTVDTETQALYVHDGTKTGGYKVIGTNRTRNNCITSISQDIKLELSSGSITLKAGSKVYVPNGVDTFDLITIENDITASTNTNLNVGASFLYYRPQQGDLVFSVIRNTSSGTTPPSDGVYYNTSTNTINDIVGNTIQDTRSFPIASVQRTGSVSKINQVFNGFGFIGSVVFVLPGVQGIISQGKNADGTVKNTEFAISSVKTTTITSDNSWDGRYNIYIDTDGNISNNPTILEYNTDSQPTTLLAGPIYWWSPKDNQYYYSTNRGASWAVVNKLNCLSIEADYNTQNILNIKTKEVFTAVDITTDNNTNTFIEDKKNIGNWSNNIANVIKNIPIKVILETEYNNYTATNNIVLKKGSTVYFPNGNTYEEVTVSNDITIAYTPYNDKYMLFLAPNSTTYANISLEHCYSGDTAPIISSGNDWAWYDTANNQVKITSDAGTTWTSGYSLPFGTAINIANTRIQVENIFNGFGFIGSTVFVLPGVCGVLPYGLNEDSTCRNLISTTKDIQYCTNLSSINGEIAYCLTTGGTIMNSLNDYWHYNEIENYFKSNQEAGNLIVCILATSQVTNGIITKWKPRSVFHAADSFDVLKYRIVSNLPANPDPDTFYFVTE